MMMDACGLSDSYWPGHVMLIMQSVAHMRSSELASQDMIMQV